MTCHWDSSQIRLQDKKPQDFNKDSTTKYDVIMNSNSLRRGLVDAPASLSGAGGSGQVINLVPKG